MKLTPKNVRLWLFLCSQGGWWTAEEVAQRIGGDSYEIFRSLHAMSRRNLIAKNKPEHGERRLRYGVTGTCLVPYGVSVAEAQA